MQRPESVASAAALPPSRNFSLTVTPMVARVLVLALSALLVLLLQGYGSSLMRLLDERVGSWSWLLLSDEAREERVTIVAIDEKSLAEVGPWPWPREVLTQLSRSLTQAGASLQLYDVVLPEARAGDDVLAATLKSAPALLSQVPVLHRDQGVRTGTMSDPLVGVRCQSPVPVSGDYVASHEGFAAVGKGHIAPTMDDDGFIRSVPAVICVDGKVYPALAVSALLHSVSGEGVKQAVLTRGKGWMAPAYELGFPQYPGIRVPLDGAGQVRVSYLDDPQSYQVISAADVLRGDVEPGLLEGSWVLVGATAFGLGDIVPTPYAGVVPGVEIQARLLTSLLDGQIPYAPQFKAWALLSIAVVVTGLMLLMAGIEGRTAAVGLLAIGILVPVLCFLIHTLALKEGFWLGWVSPSLYALFGGAGLSLLEHTRARDERQRVFANLNSYLPSGVAGEIAFNAPAGVVEASRQELVVLCADLRNFSAFEEMRPPEESAAVLHNFFTRAGEIVGRHGGNIHEYKGDSFLAVWPAHEGAGARAALAAACELVLEVESVLPEMMPAGLEPLALGVGIEQGSALVGSIGPAQRRTHTLLGETVTVALRVQEMTAELAQPVLLGEQAASVIAPTDLLESQGDYLLPGLRRPHTLFAPRLGSPGRSGQLIHLQVLQGGLER